MLPGTYFPFMSRPTTRPPVAVLRTISITPPSPLPDGHHDGTQDGVHTHPFFRAQWTMRWRLETPKTSPRRSTTPCSLCYRVWDCRGEQRYGIRQGKDAKGGNPSGALSRSRTAHPVQILCSMLHAGKISFPSAMGKCDFSSRLSLPWRVCGKHTLPHHALHAGKAPSVVR
jgi:hypothetical protein